MRLLVRYISQSDRLPKAFAEAKSFHPFSIDTSQCKLTHIQSDFAIVIGENQKLRTLN